MILRLGIDIAVRAPHQASLADERGELLWSGHRFRTTAADLERAVGHGCPPARPPSEVTVVMEPTRNAWVPLAAWFRRRGADGGPGPARALGRPARLLRQAHQERPAGLGAARPAAAAAPRGPAPGAGPGPGRPAAPGDQAALHPGQAPHAPAWPASTRCWRSSARTGTPPSAPTWATRPPLRFLAAGYADPHTVRRLGRARLARFLHRHSRGAFGDDRGRRAPGRRRAPPPSCGTTTSTSPTSPTTSPSRPASRWR